MPPIVYVCGRAGRTRTLIPVFRVVGIGLMSVVLAWGGVVKVLGMLTRRRVVMMLGVLSG